MYFVWKIAAMQALISKSSQADTLPIVSGDGAL